MHKATSATLTAIAVSTIIGCASEPKIVDNTPKNPTAVINSSYVINGYLLPDSRGEQSVYTRGDKRRIDQTIEYDSWASKKFFGNGEVTDIARLDKNLLWYVNKEDKSYMECPIKGCAPNLLAMLGAPQTGEEDGQAEEAPVDPNACVTELKIQEFTVAPTGEKREINGFATEKYDVNWRVEYEDKEKRQDKNVLHMELWTTTPTDAMKNAWKVHEEFQQGYLDAIGMNDNPLRQYVGQQVYMALAAFTGDTNNENSWKTNAGQEMTKISGYPVSIKMEMFADSKACPEAKEPKKSPGFDMSDPMGSANDMVSGFFSKKAEEKMSPKEGEPVFRYIYEVKSVALNSEHDSIFNVPANYKMMDRN